MKDKVCSGCGKTTKLWKSKPPLCKYCAYKDKSSESKGLSFSPKLNKHSNENAKYYKEAWESHKVKKCEECGVLLPAFSPHYISHYISRGANTALRNDIRNHALLCREHHHQFEFGDRKGMAIFERYQKVKVELLREYYLGDKA